MQHSEATPEAPRRRACTFFVNSFFFFFSIFNMEKENVNIFLYDINRTPTRFYEHMDHLEDFFLLAGYKSNSFGDRAARIVTADAKTANEIKKLPSQNEFKYSRYVLVDERIHRPFEAYMDLIERVGHIKKTGNRIGSISREKAFRIKSVDKNYMTISVNYPSRLTLEEISDVVDARFVD